MRRLLVGTVVLGLVSIATPAQAASVKVNAADNAVAWDSTDLCSVNVDDTYDHEVNLWCIDHGTAWVRVKVPGVRGHVTRVLANGDGDCSGKSLTYTKVRTVVRVTIEHSGDFDCVYTNVTVRYS